MSKISAQISLYPHSWSGWGKDSCLALYEIQQAAAYLVTRLLSRFVCRSLLGFPTRPPPANHLGQ